MKAPQQAPATAAQGAPGRPALRVLIVQSRRHDSEVLAGFVTAGDGQVWQTADLTEAAALARRHAPDLLFLDIHFPGDDWLKLLDTIRKELPGTRIVVTNRTIDLDREHQAMEHGAQVFLRQPFTRPWVERALARVGLGAPEAPTPSRTTEKPIIQARLPRVRTPVRLKITLPYFLLGLALLGGASYLISRYVLDTFQERFVNQLIDAGKLSADAMVQEEVRLLATLRLLAYTEGMVEAVSAGDVDAVRNLAYPIAVNERQETIEILDVNGASILSLRHKTGGGVEEYDFVRGDRVFREWDFVQAVLARQVDLQGDKYAGLARAPWGDYFYVAGPIRDLEGNLAGVVLVGTSLNTLTRHIREITLAQVTIYNRQGQRVASTVSLDIGGRDMVPENAAQVLQQQDEGGLTRELVLGSAGYTEIVGPWEARNGEDLGLIGSALPRNYLVQPTALTRVQAFAFVIIAFLIIIVTGFFLARRITRPLTEIVQASTLVAQGNLDVKVGSAGDDEVAVLGHAFNYMVSGLQEGFIYRDLLGRTVSPEVREQLRQSFASGDLRLEGQNVVATVLMTDVRGFTSLAEREAPTTVMAWLNEYFGDLVPIVQSYSGVVDKFEGDAMLTFFGILPQPFTPQESAYQACRAALEMLDRIELLNARRLADGHPPFVTGIGINTGLVTAGGLGAAERLDYTIIGDTVNTAQRLESFTRAFEGSGIVISEHALAALADLAAEFDFQPLGAHIFKGKKEAVMVYRLCGRVVARPPQPA